MYDQNQSYGRLKRNIPMEMRVLGCYGGELPGYRVCSFAFDGKLLLDAGSMTSVLRPAEQRRISHILVSHTHLDHIKDIPFLAANLVGERWTGLSRSSASVRSLKGSNLIS